jgi:hypothetical protein
MNLSKNYVDKIRIYNYDANLMNDLRHIEQLSVTESVVARARAGDMTIACLFYAQGEGSKNISGPGGQRKPLNWLKTDKEIQGKPGAFFDRFCSAMAQLG